MKSPTLFFHMIANGPDVVMKTPSFPQVSATLSGMFSVCLWLDLLLGISIHSVSFVCLCVSDTVYQLLYFCNNFDKC